MGGSASGVTRCHAAGGGNAVSGISAGPGIGTAEAAGGRGGILRWRRLALGGWLRRGLRWVRSSWVDIVWAVFVGVNLLGMRETGAWSTVPFLVIWVSLTLVYGFRMWRLQAAPICKAWKAAQPYLAYRKRLGDSNPWKYLGFLEERARREIFRTCGDAELKVWQRESYRGQRLPSADDRAEGLKE